jgi:GNAT superfamily N-acetyltransferase
MLRVRPIEEEGSSVTFGCFEGEKEMGRVGFSTEATTPDPAWLGDLPSAETFLFGLELPWEGDWFAVGQELVLRAMEGLAPDSPRVIQANTNLEIHQAPWSRLHLFEAIGFGLFQEKHGYLWVDAGEPMKAGIVTRSLDEVGDDVYREVFAGVPAGTIDRNDAYYWAGAGPENWARVMMGFGQPEDRSTWLIGYEGTEPVGMVALSAFDEPETGTIAYIGVLPEHRGYGYGRRLLTAATVAARGRGFKQILSDVDVLNRPMRAAMVAAGHQPDLRRWHKWAYWLKLSS